MEINNYNFDKHYGLISDFLKTRISSVNHEMSLFPEKSTNSFLIFENGKLLSYIPLYYQIDKKENKHGKFLNLSLPGPIISDEISNKKFKKLLNLILEELNKNCLKHKIKTIKINFSDLIDYNTNSQKYIILLENLIDAGYVDKSFLGLRLNLKKEMNEIIKNISKGHKSEIKKQIKKKYIFKNYKDEKLKYKQFYEMLSNQVDSEDYTNRLYEIYKKNKIIIGYENGEKDFSVIFSLINNTSEYLVDNNIKSSHHSLILEIIKYLKKLNNIEYFDFGIIGYLYNSDLFFSQKKENITIFKKGFGGEKYLLSVFEKKYF